MLETIKKIRSYRSFDGDREISMEELRYIVNGARLSMCSRNSQNIRYKLINDKVAMNKIFENTKYAAAIDWNPKKEESATGYILLCTEKDLDYNQNLLYFDMGVAANNIILMADSLGLNGCILGAYNKAEVEKILNLSNQYKSHILIALGKGLERVSLVPTSLGETKYVRNKDKHFVPKRGLDEVIIK